MFISLDHKIMIIRLDHDKSNRIEQLAKFKRLFLLFVLKLTSFLFISSKSNKKLVNPLEKEENRLISFRLFKVPSSEDVNNSKNQLDNN